MLQDPNAALALAHLLKHLHEHHDLRLRIGETARRTAEAYSWDRNAAPVWEFLNEVLQGSRSRRSRL